MGTFGRVKKYNKPSIDIDEKVKFLNKELKKTGFIVEEPTNSTSNVYSNISYLQSYKEKLQAIKTSGSDGEEVDAHFGDTEGQDYAYSPDGKVRAVRFKGYGMWQSDPNAIWYMTDDGYSYISWNHTCYTTTPGGTAIGSGWGAWFSHGYGAAVRVDVDSNGLPIPDDIKAAAKNSDGEYLTRDDFDLPPTKVVTPVSLDDPSYFPGNPIKYLASLLDTAAEGIDYLKGKAAELIDDAKEGMDIISSKAVDIFQKGIEAAKTAKEVQDQVSQLATTLNVAGGTFGKFLLHNAGISQATESNPLTIALPQGDAQAVSNTINTFLQSIPPENWSNLTQSQLNTINSQLALGQQTNISTITDQPRFEAGYAKDEYHNTVNNIGRPDAFANHIQYDADGNPTHVTGLDDNYTFTDPSDALGGLPAALVQITNLSPFSGTRDESPYVYTYDDGGQVPVSNMPISVPFPSPKESGQASSGTSNKEQKVSSSTKSNKDAQIAYTGYSIEDKINVQNYHKKKQQNPNYKPKGYELDSLQRQMKAQGSKTQVAHYEPRGRVLSEKKDPLRGKEKWFNKKDVKPDYPEKAPPEMIDGWHPKLHKKFYTSVKDPVLKISKKDLNRQHLFKDDEIKEFTEMVDNINQLLDMQPELLPYVQQRYPANDTRLAALNYKMDIMLEAGKEYIDKHFPVNKTLFKRAMESIKKNIELTDPKHFEKVKEPPKYIHLKKYDLPKITETVNRHFKKKKFQYKSWHKGHLSST